MASACALAIFSGKIIINFGIPERLRTLRYSIFTSGVVEINGRSALVSCGNSCTASMTFYFPRRASAGSGAADAACLYDPFCEKVAQKRPQAFLSHKL